MPRPRLERPVYSLVKRPDKRKWYVTWTDTVSGRSRYHSTGIEIERPGDPDEEPDSEAKAYLSAFEQRREAPQEGATVSELMDKRMEAWKAMRPRSKAAVSVMKSFHGFVKGYFGALRPGDIVPETILGYHAHRAKNTKRHGGGKPIVAITRELEELRTGLLYAVENRWIPGAPKITFPAPRPPRSVVMTVAQSKKLQKAAKSAHLRLFILIALATGQRRGAILDLTWDRVDFATGNLDFRNPEEQETNKRRAIANVPAGVLTALRKARKMAQTPFVIEYRGERVMNIKTAFNKAAEDAGLPWVTPHVLKHSVISWLAEAGHTVEKISDMTATDIPTVRRIYRKVSPESLGELRDSLGAILFGAPKKQGKRAINPTPGRNNRKRANAR